VYQEIVAKHLGDGNGIGDVEASAGPYGARFHWQVGDPSVAIIIPTLDNEQMLAPLVDSIFAGSYKNFTINIVDNGSKDPALLEYYEALRGFRKVSIIAYERAFNYSEAINLGAANSQSDLLLFLNDDMRATNNFWLEELIQWASLPKIGVVGTKLIRKNHTIQHAGIILGLNNFAGHIYLNAPEHYDGLFGSVDWYRNYLALTGACQMVRREVFDAVGGYDERFALAFGDIDFCLKVYEKGFINMYTPFATLYHYEGQSRGYSTPVDDIVNGYERMGSFLNNSDPYYSPNLTYTPIPRCNTDSPEARHAEIERRRSLYHSD
jgi:GT2 family glycosyltransferase